MLPGVTVEASSPALIEKVNGRDQRSRSMPGSVDPGRAHGDLYADRFQHHREDLLGASFSAHQRRDEVGAVSGGVTVTGESRRRRPDQ